MGHQHQLLTPVACRQSVDTAHDPQAQRFQRLTPAWRSPPWMTVPPRACLMRKSLFNLGIRHSLELTKTTLTQVFLRCHWQLMRGSNSPCGFKSTGQITCINGRYRLVRQINGRPIGLPLPSGIQANIEMPLNAGIHIPQSFSMPYGNDSGRLLH
jgi:hypothetical protein